MSLWVALVLAGAVGGACWLIGESRGYWRALDDIERDTVLRLRYHERVRQAFEAQRRETAIKNLLRDVGGR